MTRICAVSVFVSGLSIFFALIGGKMLFAVFVSGAAEIRGVFFASFGCISSFLTSCSVFFSALSAFASCLTSVFGSGFTASAVLGAASCFVSAFCSSVFTGVIILAGVSITFLLFAALGAFGVSLAACSASGAFFAFLAGASFSAA